MVRTIFPNAFQQGNASIYTFVYLVRAPNSRTQSMSQLRGKTSNLANVSQGLWLLGSWLAPWRPESRDKKEIKGMSQSFIFLFLMPSSILEALGVGRAENLALFSDASLTFLFSVSYFLLLSSVALFPPVALFFSFLIPPSNEISKASLSSSCASVGEGDQSDDGNDEEDDASHNCPLS